MNASKILYRSSPHETAGSRAHLLQQVAPQMV